jgi:hypothetical protein
MGKFLDALFMKQTIQPSRIDPATIAQPVPVAMAHEPPSDLTSGAAFNQAAIGAWPTLIDGGAKFWNGGWRPSVLREVHYQNILGNYGGETSKALFGFRFRAFNGIGNLSGTMNVPERHTYNDLIPIAWGLRVSNPNTISNTTAQKGPITIQNAPSTWQGSNTASLNKSGVTLL